MELHVPPETIVEERLSRFIAACRELGLKVTHQRTEIFRELAATNEHPDAETIYERVHARIPALSLDTVYRTLRTLEEHGVVARVGSMRDRARFDANTDRHHHFVCTQCGLVSDFYSDELDGFDPPEDVQRVGEVASVYVELRGICRACREATPPA
jgi:Fur family peroxide stress response transcriptional regulator